MTLSFDKRKFILRLYFRVVNFNLRKRWHIWKCSLQQFLNVKIWMEAKNSTLGNDGIINYCKLLCNWILMQNLKYTYEDRKKTYWMLKKSTLQNARWSTTVALIIKVCMWKKVGQTYCTVTYNCVRLMDSWLL